MSKSMTTNSQIHGSSPDKNDSGSTASVVHEPWCTDHVHEDPSETSEAWDSCQRVLFERSSTYGQRALVAVEQNEDRTVIETFAESEMYPTSDEAREMAAALVAAADLWDAIHGGEKPASAIINDRPDEPYERQDDCPSWCRSHLYDGDGNFGEPVTLHRAVIVHGELDDHVAINLGPGMTWGETGVPSADQPVLEVEGFIWVDAAGTRDLIAALQTGLRLLETGS